MFEVQGVLPAAKACTADVILLRPVANGQTVGTDRDAYGLPPAFRVVCGLEGEAIKSRLRLRPGTYLEPGVRPGVGLRTHVAGGLDLFISSR